MLVRYAVSMEHYFDPTDSTTFTFPVRSEDGYTYINHRKPTWEELQSLIEKEGFSQPLTFLPPEFQLEKLILLTTSRLEVPATFGTVFDLGWNIAALTSVSHDAIITTEKVFPFLEKELSPAIKMNLQGVVFVGNAAAPKGAAAFPYTTHHLSHPFDAYVD